MEISCSSTSLLASRLPTKLSSSRHASLASRNSLLFRNGGRGLYERSVSWVSRRSRGPRPAPRRLGCRCLFGLGVPELVVIAGVAALIFGPKQLPEIGRSIGKTIKSFQQAAKEFETELKKEPEDASKSPPPAESSKAVSDQEDEKELETSGKKESA